MVWENASERFTSYIINCFIIQLAGATYPSLSDVMEALKVGKVNATLVDMYVPLKRKDLFNGTWFEIAALLDAKITHGILLKGEAMKLEREIKNLIVKNDVQTNYLKPKENKEEEVRLDVYSNYKHYCIEME